MDISISLDPAAGKDLEQYVDFLNTQQDVLVHLDVMDGQFVPRESVTHEEFVYVLENSVHPIDAHFMVEKPDFSIWQFLPCLSIVEKLRSITFHIEALAGKAGFQLLKKIKRFGIEAGIAIDLPTEIEAVDRELLENSDVITIMSVKCGASGQKNNAEEMQKRLRYVTENFPKARLIVDGGINPENIKLAKNAGAHTAVVGGYAYGAEDRAVAIDELKAIS